MIVFFWIDWLTHFLCFFVWIEILMGWDEEHVSTYKVLMILYHWFAGPSLCRTPPDYPKTSHLMVVGTTLNDTEEALEIVDDTNV